MINELSTSTFAVLSSISLLGGFLGAATGSSGMLALPLLLAVGVPPHVALGTSKFYTTAVLSTATIHFIRRKIFDPRYWVAAGVATLLGSLVGILLVQLITPTLLRKILPLAIGVLSTFSMYLLFSGRQKSRMKGSMLPITQQPKSFYNVLLGGILGVYSGALGIGTGIFWTTAIMRFFKVDLTTANAISSRDLSVLAALNPNGNE